MQIDQVINKLPSGRRQSNLPTAKIGGYNPPEFPVEYHTVIAKNIRDGLWAFRVNYSASSQIVSVKQYSSTVRLCATPVAARTRSAHWGSLERLACFCGFRCGIIIIYA